MAVQRKGFASHMHRQAKAKKIQTILKPSLETLLDLFRSRLRFGAGIAPRDTGCRSIDSGNPSGFAN
jgi:hypothetical protein